MSAPTKMIFRPVIQSDFRHDLGVLAIFRPDLRLQRIERLERLERHSVGTAPPLGLQIRLGDKRLKCGKKLIVKTHYSRNHEMLECWNIESTEFLTQRSQGPQRRQELIDFSSVIPVASVRDSLCLLLSSFFAPCSTCPP